MSTPVAIMQEREAMMVHVTKTQPCPVALGEDQREPRQTGR